MANKRMFTKKICDSDAFLEMPLSTQCLYFHLNMQADDDGFVGNPKKIMRVIGASEDDLKLLIAKKFLLIYEDSGVIVIKHWRMHNTISKQRYHETTYIDEKNMLLLKDNGAYSFSEGEPLNDSAVEETFRLSDKRRTSGEQTENSDLDLGLDLDIDLDLDKDLDNTTTATDNNYISLGDAHGHVKLTLAQVRALNKKYGPERITLIITRLDNYIEQSGRQYNNHFELIQKWIAEDEKRGSG